jgi:cytochrome c peroxidase
MFIRKLLSLFLVTGALFDVAYAQGGAIEPIPLSSGQDARKVALGEALFLDKRLSGDDTVSCASCHVLSLARYGGADGKRVSVGVLGAKGGINAPTVFNSGLNFRQFWDGRAATLEDQVNGPVQAGNEMGSTWEQVVKKLSSDAGMVAKFKAIYPDGVSSGNIRDAIATFERSLLTPNSRFDQFLRGSKSALSADELKGYQLFKSYGCIACHQGVNIGGNMYQTLGAMGDYFADRGNVTEADLGRFNVTKSGKDKHLFKVPSLRNVAVTGPYFHDGSANSLDEAVDVMFKYQLGRMATRQDRELIVKFLLTLTGEYKEKVPGKSAP